MKSRGKMPTSPSKRFFVTCRDLRPGHNEDVVGFLTRLEGSEHGRTKDGSCLQLAVVLLFPGRVDALHAEVQGYLTDEGRLPLPVGPGPQRHIENMDPVKFWESRPLHPGHLIRVQQLPIHVLPELLEGHDGLMSR
ncbi:hypothetical protein INR49_016400 [Caranx melampygus]|nr:hypothetical protein INR49_016400 [Caranx melampygus]